MNPLALQFANGTAFFLGMGGVVIAVILRLECPRMAEGFFAAIFCLIGVALAVLSATPLAPAVWLLWLVLAAAVFVLTEARLATARWRWWRLTVVTALTGVSLVLCMHECRFHLTPVIALKPGQAVYVIGDSLSAGIDTGERTWPHVLAAALGRPVINLAEAGATVRSAMRQAARVSEPKALVLVEIGGNDLLGGTGTGAFADDLERLLGTLADSGHRIAMFELPLLPFRNGYGRVQRRLAAANGVTLIPKRCLTRVLGLRGGTVDGLHLSAAGHEALAESAYRMLASAQEPGRDRGRDDRKERGP